MKNKIVSIHNFYSAKTIKIPCTNDDVPGMEDFIIFQDEENQEEIGKVLCIGEAKDEAEEETKNYSILRKATAHDIQKHETNQERNKMAFETCLEKINNFQLGMNLLLAKYSFNGTKINFIFTAESRVDFRELVKDLASHFKKQIHLQQIGPRDRAKFSGGLGKCGQEICCKRYLKKFESISMDMVRSQKMENKGSEKLSGLCGKLLCCLRYEVDQYKELKEKIPGKGSILHTKEGEGTVIGVDILNQKVKIKANDHTIFIIPVEEIIKVIKEAKEDDTEMNVTSM